MNDRYCSKVMGEKVGAKNAQNWWVEFVGAITAQNLWVVYECIDEQNLFWVYCVQNIWVKFVGEDTTQIYVEHNDSKDIQFRIIHF